MDKMLFVGNWKSHKSKQEGELFFHELAGKIASINLAVQDIVIAPPFTFLDQASRLIAERKLPVTLCGQNVSSFPEGAYTGEINARQLKEVAEFVIVGHSERRRYLHESETDIENKVRESKEAGLTVIQCIQNEYDRVFSGTEIVAYEPPSAIGTGNVDTNENIEEVFAVVKKNNPHVRLMYGGSVAPTNIKALKEISNIGGFLIGGASLDVDSFLSLLN